MKRLPLLMNSMLVCSFAVSMPVALAHVGHGDEFQAEGGVDRVEVNAETDPLLGIQVNPIEPAADGGETVMIPMTALVEDTERQLVFVEYEGFYEPVTVTTGTTEGAMIEILEGISIGEQLVTQGSLSLYAESRKAQTAETEPEAAEIIESDVSAEVDSVVGAAEPAAPAIEDASETAEPALAEASSGFPVRWVAAIGAGIACLVGAGFVLSGGKKKSV